MIAALKVYSEIGFDGVIIPDRVPVLNSVSEPWHNGMSYPVGCSSCGHEYLLAFSCKRRHFCPSCHAKRVIEFGNFFAQIS